jgi:hypothetical protein
MPAVKFFACLDFEPVSVDSENPPVAKGSSMEKPGVKIYIVVLLMGWKKELRSQRQWVAPSSMQDLAGMG